MMKSEIIVNDRMQKNYRYELSALPGEDFAAANSVRLCCNGLMIPERFDIPAMVMVQSCVVPTGIRL